MKSDNPPRKHHYSPAFYLKQWAGADGCVCEMRRWPTGVADRRRHPNATGFEYDLYKVKGVPREHAQRFESIFMSLVDNLADRALQKHLHPDGKPWNDKLATAWALFIMSLLYRNPHAVNEIRNHIISLWRTAVEYLPENDRHRFERDFQHVMHIGASNFLQTVINSERVGRTIASFEWFTLTLDRSSKTLLTSDRPLDIPFGLDNPLAYIALPISPTKLFVAAKSRTTFNTLIAMPHTKIVKAINLAVVAQARQYVWGVDDSQTAFVRKHIGTGPERVIITQKQRNESLAAVRAAPKIRLEQTDPLDGLSSYWQGRLEDATSAPASLTSSSSEP